MALAVPQIPKYLGGGVVNAIFSLDKAKEAADKKVVDVLNGINKVVNEGILGNATRFGIWSTKKFIGKQVKDMLRRRREAVAKMLTDNAYSGDKYDDVFLWDSRIKIDFSTLRSEIDPQTQTEKNLILVEYKKRIAASTDPYAEVAQIASELLAKGILRYTGSKQAYDKFMNEAKSKEPNWKSIFYDQMLVETIERCLDIFEPQDTFGVVWDIDYDNPNQFLDAGRYRARFDLAVEQFIQTFKTNINAQPNLPVVVNMPAGFYERPFDLRVDNLNIFRNPRTLINMDVVQVRAQLGIKPDGVGLVDNFNPQNVRKPAEYFRAHFLADAMAELRQMNPHVDPKNWSNVVIVREIEAFLYKLFLNYVDLGNELSNKSSAALSSATQLNSPDTARAVAETLKPKVAHEKAVLDFPMYGQDKLPQVTFKSLELLIKALQGAKINFTTTNTITSDTALQIMGYKDEDNKKGTPEERKQVKMSKIYESVEKFITALKFLEGQDANAGIDPATGKQVNLMPYIQAYPDSVERYNQIKTLISQSITSALAEALPASIDNPQNRTELIDTIKELVLYSNPQPVNINSWFVVGSPQQNDPLYQINLTKLRNLVEPLKKNNDLKDYTLSRSLLKIISTLTGQDFSVLLDDLESNCIDDVLVEVTAMVSAKKKLGKSEFDKFYAILKAIPPSLNQASKMMVSRQNLENLMNYLGYESLLTGTLNAQDVVEILPALLQLFQNDLALDTLDKNTVKQRIDSLDAILALPNLQQNNLAQATTLKNDFENIAVAFRGVESADYLINQYKTNNSNITKPQYDQVNNILRGVALNQPSVIKAKENSEKTLADLVYKSLIADVLPESFDIVSQNLLSLFRADLNHPDVAVLRQRLTKLHALLTARGLSMQLLNSIGILINDYTIEIANRP